MIKLIASFIFSVILYFIVLMFAWVFKTDVATTFAFALAVLMIEDRMPPDHS